MTNIIFNCQNGLNMFRKEYYSKLINNMVSKSISYHLRFAERVCIKLKTNIYSQLFHTGSKTIGLRNS